MPEASITFSGAGLGLRRALLGPLSEMAPGSVDFMEVAPENWISVGGRFGRTFRELAEQYPIALHGLSLNIGGSAPLDEDLVAAIGEFMREFNCPIYSEHLTYCGDDGHLYDLLPIPFTEEAVHHVAQRVRRVQDILGERIALENASYYAAPHQAMKRPFLEATIPRTRTVLSMTRQLQLKMINRPLSQPTRGMVFHLRQKLVQVEMNLS